MWMSYTNSHSLQRKIIMSLQMRTYRDSTDFAHMRQLLMIGTQSQIPASYTHPGCLDWATHIPPDEAAWQRNFRLWEDTSADPPLLAAWTIFMPNEGTFDLFIHPTLHGTPTHATIMDAYVAWAEGRAREVGVSQPTDEPFAWLEDLWLAAAYRGQGIGGEVLRLVEEELSRRNIRSLSLHVGGSKQAALRLYQKQGFRITGYNLSKQW
jgi:ribosomal protein S18 acetylase RimI-like enzyme